LIGFSLKQRFKNLVEDRTMRHPEHDSIGLINTTTGVPDDN